MIYNGYEILKYVWLVMNTMCRCWESWMVVLVAYSVWVCPFEVAFIHDSPHRKLFIMDNIVDLFFAVDIVLTFFLAYIDRTTDLLVLDSRKIALRLVHLHFLLLYMSSPVGLKRLTHCIRSSQL